MPLTRTPKILVFVICTSLFSGCDVSRDPTLPGLPGPAPSKYDWTELNYNTSLNFSDVFFTDNNIGWIVGDENTILSTVDGGVTWPQAPGTILDGNFRGAHLLSESMGWLVGDMNGSNKDGNIYLSTNGGAYPEIQKSVEYPLNAIFSLDKDHVWAGGENGQMLYSQDGGINWMESTTDLELTVFDIQFLDPDTGFACGSTGIIIKSADGGINWEEELTIPGIDFTALYYKDTETGWACGSNNSIFLYEAEASTSSWTQVTIINEPAGTVWRDIFFVDDHIGWLVGDGGAVYRTEDAGKSWEKETTGIFEDLNAIYMFGYNAGWIVGEEGLIMTYTP